MSDLYNKINDDLKQAMINKDHRKVSVLKMLKSAILYAALDSGTKDNMSDDQVINILRKEAKKREEASSLYAKAGDSLREENEKYEKEIVDQYLPAMLSEEDVAALVDKSIAKIGEVTPRDLGKVIADVKNESKGLADGSIIARIVKEKINK